MRSTLLMSGKKKPTATEAMVGLFSVVLSVAVVAALYFGRDLLVPLALAGLLAFVLSPLVTRIERVIGRGAAVSAVAIFVFFCMGMLSWIVTRQALDLVSQLPNYRTNIEKKLHAIELSKDGPVKRFSTMVAELESEIPVIGGTRIAAEESAPKTHKDLTSSSLDNSAPDSGPLSNLKLIIAPFFSVLATCGIVIVLVIFMLLQREDLRGRFIKIIGQGRISHTSRAMEDASDRVSRYLITQLVVNIAFGATVALGLYAIGLPNAFLWGALSAVLRFIPYVGSWLAAFCPLVLALAVSPGWQMLLLTLTLFAVLELATGNLLEPLLYRSSTGVSSLALIVAAIFWTWLWGPIGLLLSTPLTVVLAVIGRHVPRLSFFSILLGNEEPLTPAEECYHRLLVGGLNEAGRVVDAYVNANSLTSLYDNVLVPAVTMAEIDHHREELEESQRSRVTHGIRDIINDLSSRPCPQSQIEADKALAAEPTVIFPKSDCRVVCIATRGERDEVAGAMMTHLLRIQGFEANAAAHNSSVAQLTAYIEDSRADAICISVLPPTTLIHARHLCSQLRAKHHDLRIVVGLWGATEHLEDAVRGLQQSGANEVVVSMAEAVVQLGKFSSSLSDVTTDPTIPVDEDVRVAALSALPVYGTKSNPLFDRMTKTLTRTFNVPVALITLIDRDRQHFKSQVGLPEEIAAVCDIPREDSVCTHVVAGNAALVVEDLARDRRFSKNTLLKKYHLRFYAGVPLHAANGQPVGALCILDTKPRRFSEADKSLLKVLAEEISDMLLPSVTTLHKGEHHKIDPHKTSVAMRSEHFFAAGAASEEG